MYTFHLFSYIYFFPAFDSYWRYQSYLLLIAFFQYSLKLGSLHDHIQLMKNQNVQAQITPLCPIFSLSKVLTFQFFETSFSLLLTGCLPNYNLYDHQSKMLHPRFLIFIFLFVVFISAFILIIIFLSLRFLMLVHFSFYFWF